MISVAASPARYPFSDLLCRADGRRSRSRDLGGRKNQGLSALVLGGPAGLAARGPLSQRSQSLLRIYLSAAASGSARDTLVFWQTPALYMPLGAQHRSVVDDRAILQRDDRIGAHAQPVAVRVAGFRHGILCFRYVRSWAAESRSAGDHAVRVLGATARAAVDRGKHVRAGHRDKGFPDRGVSVSGMAAAV